MAVALAGRKRMRRVFAACAFVACAHENIASPARAAPLAPRDYALRVRLRAIGDAKLAWPIVHISVLETCRRCTPQRR